FSGCICLKLPRIAVSRAGTGLGGLGYGPSRVDAEAAGLSGTFDTWRQRLSRTTSSSAALRADGRRLLRLVDHVRLRLAGDHGVVDDDLGRVRHGRQVVHRIEQ